MQKISQKTAIATRLFRPRKMVHLLKCEANYDLGPKLVFCS
jgi:hypothetical protein